MYSSQRVCTQTHSSGFNDNEGFLKIEEAIHKVKIRLDELRGQETDAL